MTETTNPGTEHSGPVDPFLETMMQSQDEDVNTLFLGEQPTDNDTDPAMAPSGQPKHGDAGNATTGDAASGDATRPPLPDGFDIKPIPDHLKPEDAYNMARHWQSEVSRMKRELEDVRKNAVPKEVMDRLERLEQPPTPEPEPLTRPVRPVRPDDAYGEEWDQYVEDMAKFEKDFDAYELDRLARLDKKIEQVEQTELQKRQEIEQQQLMATATQDAMVMFGMDQETATSFVQSVADGSIFRDEALIAEAFKLRNNGAPAQNTEQQKPSSGTDAQSTAQVDSLIETVRRKNAAQQQAPVVTPAGQGVPPEQPKPDGLFVQETAGGVDPWS